MFTEEYLKNNPAIIKVFMGSPAEVFWEIVSQATKSFDEYEQRRLDRPDRQRSVGGGRKCELPLAIRIALVLTYMRLGLSQEATALLYGLNQVDVSRQLRQVLPLVVELLPAPEIWEKLDAENPLTAEEMLAITDLVDDQVIIDATEQQVNRPEDNPTRKAYYSGKKGQFTLVTQMVTDGEHHIVAISICFPGAMVDKTISDEVGTMARLPDDCHAKADKGYQGIDKQVETKSVENPETGEIEEIPRFTVETPFKKPRGGELSDEQLEFNRRLGTTRVRVEHCIGWVKNWAILANRFRAHHDIYTLVMQAVCGLVNLQTARWQAHKT